MIWETVNDIMVQEESKIKSQLYSVEQIENQWWDINQTESKQKLQG